MKEPASIFKILEECLVRAVLPPPAQKQHASGKIALEFLKPIAQKINLLSQKYVSREQFPSIQSTSKQESEAYALYYLPVNFGKLLQLLHELPLDFFSRSLKILDFGCGPGTASLACISSFSQALQIDAIDKSASMLDLAVKLSRDYDSTLRTRLQRKSRELKFRAGSKFEPSQKYDLIIAANVINELKPEASLPMLLQLIECLEDKAALVLLEPALLNATRALMLLRDKMLGLDASLVPLFPCTRRDDCPMLKNSANDWCHGTLEEINSPWNHSILLHQLDELTGFNKHRIKYAAFVFQKNGTLKSGYRVITAPEKSNRGTQALLCGTNLYGECLLGRKDKTEQNASFTRLKQFSRAEISHIDEKLQLSPQSVISLQEQS